MPFFLGMNEEPVDNGEKSGRVPDEAGDQPDLERAQAMAEFAELEKLLQEPLPAEGDDLYSEASAERWRRSNLVLTFLEKHRAQLRDVDFNGKDVEEMLAAFKEQRKEVEEIRRVEDEAQGQLYHAAANYAEANTELQVALFEWMSELEELSAEQLEALPIEKRNEIIDLILRWQNVERQECLEQLPIDLRRKLEGKRPS